MLELFTSPEAWVSLATLTVLEIVLGIDNLVFISILAGRLPEEQRPQARRFGLALALVSRLALLFSIAWLARLQATAFVVGPLDLSWRDLILLAGGIFLLVKGTLEIHKTVEGTEEERTPSAGGGGFLAVVVQISVIDIVFSLDSVITAVGLADHVEVMAAAIIIAVIVMLLAVNVISDFVDRHPTVKMLALSFLLMVGLALVADGLEFHVPRGYLYFAMAFSAFVETLNLLARRRARAA